MKLLKLLYQFPLYILYVMITLEKRTDYMVGQERGAHVEKSRDVSWFIPGTTTEYTFNPNKKPKKEYATWKEFWCQYGYYQDTEEYHRWVKAKKEYDELMATRRGL